MQDEVSATCQYEGQYLIEQKVLLNLGGQRAVERHQSVSIVDLHDRKSDKVDDQATRVCPQATPHDTVSALRFDWGVVRMTNSGDGTHTERVLPLGSSCAALRDVNSAGADDRGVDSHRYRRR